jgi:pimeloyl-ACP methyl ester carboxylesterase
MKKVFIQNRHGARLAVVLELAEDPKGLGFVMHGLGGFKEQPHIQIFSKALIDSGYSVVLFDTTNTFGESDGRYEDATTTNYHQDLEDVIAWAEGQEWYIEPFILVGHSLGGISTALYAEHHPEKVKALAPISTVVSGQLSMEADRGSREVKEWRESGWRVTESKSKPGIMKRLPWSHMEDRAKYNLIPDARNLTMPIFLAAGSEDDTTPFAHQKLLAEAVTGDVELHEMEGAGHTFRDQYHLDELYELLRSWIDRVEKAGH